MAFLSPEKLNFIWRKRRDAYLTVFGNAKGEIVLKDLMDECGWGKDLFNENPYVTANLVGQRHAILHIKAILGSTDRDLDRLVSNQKKIEEDYSDG
jgi:hypothetical protein